jgi:hypothetical protein
MRARRHDRTMTVSSLVAIFLVGVVACGPVESLDERPRAAEEPTGENLLLNPSFEELDADGLPVHWSAHLQPVVGNDPAIAKSGSVAILCQESFVSQAVPVEGGRRYSLGHFTRTDSPGHAARLQVNFTDAAGKMVDVKIEVPPAGSEWSWNEMNLVAPKNAAAAIVYVQTHEAGSVWFDDIWFGRGSRAGRPETAVVEPDETASATSEAP